MYEINLDAYGPIGIMQLVGDLDYGMCSDFRTQLVDFLSSDFVGLVLDLSEVEYLDSSALGLLLSGSSLARRSDKRLILVCNETVDNILELTRLTGVFAVESTLDGAISLHLKEAARGDQ